MNLFISAAIYITDLFINNKKNATRYSLEDFLKRH